VTFCIHFIALSFKSGKVAESAADAEDDEEYDDPDDDYAYPDEQGEADYVELPDVDAVVSPQSVSTQEAQLVEPTQQTAQQVTMSMICCVNMVLRTKTINYEGF
jgi:hypothetical protein